MGGDQRKARISKADWLSLALEELSRSGVESVRVERLAKKLGVAKSGFYWHFRDRRELLREVLEYWADEYTGVITDSEELEDLDAEDRLELVARMVDENDLAKYDLPIRAWAMQDPDAADAVRSVTKVRLDFLRKIFAELGFTGEHLDMVARAFVCYFTWEGTTFPELSRRKRTRLRKLHLAMLLSGA